jgi:hemerythrin-like domain-containing protein
VAGNDQVMTAAGTGSSPPVDSAVEIIRQEHRSLGYVVHTLQRLLHDVAVNKVDADFKLIAMMLYYIDEFPDRCHHPKEEALLFARVRARTGEANVVLDALQAQHATFAAMMSALAQAFVRWQGGAGNALQPFAQTVGAYAELLWDHMEQEENCILALARKHLTADDWRAIDDTFRANDDPLFGPRVRGEFARLKHRIINQLPGKLRARLEP